MATMPPHLSTPTAQPDAVALVLCAPNTVRFAHLTEHFKSMRDQQITKIRPDSAIDRSRGSESTVRMGPTRSIKKGLLFRNFTPLHRLVQMKQRRADIDFTGNS